MKEKAKDSSAKWTRWRRSAQIVFLTFFILLPLTYRLGQQVVLGTLASLKVGSISLIDPAAGISTLLAARRISTSVLTGMALPLLLALVLGPVFCSWVCPWGLISESLDKLLRREARAKGHWVAPLRWTVLMGVFLLSLGLGTPLAATVSAPRLISTLPMELLFLGGVTSGTVTLLCVLFVLEFILPRRLWCRALCPVGSFLVLLRTPWTLRIQWKSETCLGIGRRPPCSTCCPWNLDPRQLEPYSGCTNCARCIELCPSEPKGSLSFQNKRIQKLKADN